MQRVVGTAALACVLVGLSSAQPALADEGGVITAGLEVRSDVFIKSRVYAVGPQAGYFFTHQWYLNLKGYYEFDAQNRPEGWNAWLTLALPPSGGKK